MCHLSMYTGSIRKLGVSFAKKVRSYFYLFIFRVFNVNVKFEIFLTPAYYYTNIAIKSKVVLISQILLQRSIFKSFASISKQIEKRNKVFECFELILNFFF